MYTNDKTCVNCKFTRIMMGAPVCSHNGHCLNYDYFEPNEMISISKSDFEEKYVSRAMYSSDLSKANHDIRDLVQENETMSGMLQGAIDHLARIKTAWKDIELSQPGSGSVELFKDRDGKRIVGKFKRTDYEWGKTYWVVYDLLHPGVALHDSITHWQDISGVTYD